MAIIAKQVDFLLNGYKDPTTGALLNGGKVKTYLDGTTTLSSVWTDRGKTSYATNPIILDSAGRAEVYADGVYKFEIYDASDNLLETINGLDYSSIITGNKISIGNYGGDLAATIADIGLSEATLLIDQIVTITADATVPSNISLEKTRGGMFTGAFTLTINGGMTGDMDSAWFDVNVIPAISQVELPVSIFYSFHQALVGIGSNHTELTLNQLSTLTQDETVLSSTTLRKSITSTAFTGAFTLTINGGMTGDMLSQWFDLSVTVILGSGVVAEVYPQWWGAVPDGITDCITAINAAIITSGVHRVFFAPGTYLINSQIITKSNLSLFGAGAGLDESNGKITARIKASDVFLLDDYILTNSSPVYYLQLRDLTFDCSSIANGINIDDSQYAVSYNVMVHNATRANSYGFNITGNSVTNKFTDPVSHTCWGGIYLGNAGGTEWGGFNEFRGSRINGTTVAIKLEGRTDRNHFFGFMIDCDSADAATIGIDADAPESYDNLFVGGQVENTSATGIGYTAVNQNYTTFIKMMVSAGFATNHILHSKNILLERSAIEGYPVVSRSRTVTISGFFKGISPDGSMTWANNISRSDNVAAGIWDFPLEFNSFSVIHNLNVVLSTDDAAATTKIQIFEILYNSTTIVQVGIDYDYTGSLTANPTFEATLDSTSTYYIEVTINRAAGTYFYLYPVLINYDAT